MEKRPEMRYQSALEMAQDLQRALQEPDGTWLGRLPDKPIPSLSTPTGRQSTIHIRKRKIRNRIITAAAAAVMLIGLGIATWMIFDKIMNIVQVPYCIEETEADAIRELQRKGLAGDTYRISDESVPAGYVIKQEPAFDTQMRKGDSVTLWISTGPSEKEVPKLTDMPVEEARALLEKMGLTLVIYGERRMSSSPWDTVLEQNPLPGEILPDNEPILVILSGGSVTLPDLVNMDYTEAMLLIQKLRINCKEIRQIPTTDDSQLNRIAALEYSDKSGTRYESGQQVMEDQIDVILAIYVEAQEAIVSDAGGDASLPEGGNH